MLGFWSGFEKQAMKEVASVGIIDVDGRKLLMGKRKDNGRWTNPGGHLEKGESPIKGAIREVHEEAGIRLHEDDLIHLKSKTVTKPGGEKLKIHAYKVFFGSDRLPRTTTKNDPDEEVFGWKWIPMPGGLPKAIRSNLHVPLGRNILLDNLNLSEPDETLKPSGSIKTAFWTGFQKEAAAIDSLLRQSRKMGRSGLHGGRRELSEKLTRELPQQAAQYGEKLKKKDDEKRASDKLPGGRADGEGDSNFHPKGLKKGQRHEMEHTDSPSLAKEIAKDHLKEDKAYYDKLEKIEK